MPLGVVELREDRDGKRKVKKPFIEGTGYEITPEILRTSGWGALSFSDIDKDLDIEYDVPNNKAANVRRYAAVPTGVRRILESQGCDHSGLVLDKFVYRSADQSFAKHALQKVVEVNNATDGQWFQELRRRWMDATNQKSNPLLCCTTTGPLTLHLARASALENAGICLHPLYGFAYLPGSGLKGMARAYAETIWLPAQPDQKQAWRQIEDVFGWVPNPDRRQQIHDPNHPAEVRRRDDSDPESLEIKASSGHIVFHDAWPESWPKLIVDIVNNHHPDYYQHDDNNHAPGDWENPVPVYFLAVKPGTTFTFPLAKRRADVADELLDLARQWLLGALCHLGAGAKTVAGYGAFKPADGEPPALPTQKRVIFETSLELVTPAFLAGANQQADDCDLRPATVRGQLRWWWRTMHAAFLDVKTLRSLEAAIWGDTKGGGAVRIVIEKANASAPQAYDKGTKANFSKDQKKSEHGIPNSEPQKTTQGLWYASYGMDESGRRRFVIEPPASWRVRLIARRCSFGSNGREMAAQQVLEQAHAALWLLCQFGGVGSKAGKGFGSLSASGLTDWSLDQARRCGSKLRQALNLNDSFVDSAASSAALEQMLGPVEVKFAWPSTWSVLDQVGFAYQKFAKRYKHRREKMALGLPRRIGNPAQGTFQPTPPVTTNGRHTSPVRIHVERASGGFVVRAVAFPAAKLPNLADSRTFLADFLKEFGGDLLRRAKLQPPSMSSNAGSGGRLIPHPTAQQVQDPDKVTVKVLEQREIGGKVQFFVQEEGKPRGVLAYGIPPPADKLPQVGEVIVVYRNNQDARSPQYRWDKRMVHPGKPKGGPGGQRPRGGR